MNPTIPLLSCLALICATGCKPTTNVRDQIDSICAKQHAIGFFYGYCWAATNPPSDYITGSNVIRWGRNSYTNDFVNKHHANAD